MYKEEEVSRNIISTEQPSDKIINDIWSEYKNQGYLDPNTLLILISLVSIKALPVILVLINITISIVAYLRTKKGTISDVMSYLRPYTLKERKAIEGILYELLGASGCNRVVVGLFHNGISIGSIHFQKMSVFYEALGPGVSSVKDNIKDVPLNKIEEELLLSRQDSFTSYSRTDVNLNILCKKYLDSVGIEQVLFRNLESRIGIYGVVELQWLSKPEEDLDIRELESLDKIFNRLNNNLDLIIRDKRLKI